MGTSSHAGLNPGPAAAGPALTRWFTVIGALMIGLFSIGMALLLSGFLESRLLRRDAELSRDFAQSVVDTQKVAAMFLRGQVGGEADFIEFFAHVAAMPDVLRANVYTPQRVVLWSSRPEMIGLTFPANDELELALRGEVVAHVEDKPENEGKAEHLLLDSGPGDFVENYLPMYHPQTHQLLGVVELYRRPVALIETIRSGQLRVWQGALAGGLCLFLSLFWFVRRIEASLQSQQARLVESEALAMVGELSAAVAHSIRNPLGSIRSAAELQRELGPSAAVDVDDVIRQVDRIEHLVRTLLTYARQPAGQGHRCDLAQALRAASAHFAPELRAQGKPFQTDWPSELGEVGMEEVLLTQVLSSVLANAAEATSRGEAIRIEACRHPGQFEIRVEDGGRGIQPEALGKVAQDYYTTKPRGLGLGLSLARRAVERIGGRVRIEPLQGRGTRVSLWLPILATAERPARS